MRIFSRRRRFPPCTVFEQIGVLSSQIEEVDKEIRRIVREEEELKRLMTIPGVGEITAMAVHAFAPPMESFPRARDFSAWIGLTPRESSTGGRQRLGRITKMGQRDLRRLLVGGGDVGHQARLEMQDDSRSLVRRMLAEKPKKLVAVALANKMARVIWALSMKQEPYHRPELMGAIAG